MPRRTRLLDDETSTNLRVSAQATEVEQDTVLGYARMPEPAIRIGVHELASAILATREPAARRVSR
jgi:hypothetical protein